VTELLSGVEEWLPLLVKRRTRQSTHSLQIARKSSGEKIVHARLFEGAWPFGSAFLFAGVMRSARWSDRGARDWVDRFASGASAR